METKIRTFYMEDGLLIDLPEWAVNKKRVVAMSPCGVHEQPVPEWSLVDKGGEILLNRPPILFSLRGTEAEVCKIRMSGNTVGVKTFSSYRAEGFAEESLTKNTVRNWNWMCGSSLCDVRFNDIFVWQWPTWVAFFYWRNVRKDAGFDDVLHAPAEFFARRNRRTEEPSVTSALDGKPTLNSINGLKGVFPRCAVDVNLSRIKEAK